MRKLILVALLASSLCLILSGCGILAGVVASFDTEADEEGGSLLPKEQAWDPPPSMISSERDAFSF